MVCDALVGPYCYTLYCTAVGEAAHAALLHQCEHELHLGGCVQQVHVVPCCCEGLCSTGIPMLPSGVVCTIGWALEVRLQEEEVHCLLLL
jgi:hypothetical protein